MDKRRRPGGSETASVLNPNSEKDNGDTALIRLVCYSDLNTSQMFESVSLRNSRILSKIHFESQIQCAEGSLIFWQVPKIRLTKELAHVLV